MKRASVLAVWLLGALLLGGAAVLAAMGLPFSTRPTAAAIPATTASAAVDHGSAGTSPPQRKRHDAPGFYLGEAGLTPSEQVGREIWYKATAGNARFHTYTFQQRLGILVDWYRVLRADQRDQRFAAWGLINDPGCCTPGSDGCPARSLEQTYGFDWCPGDNELLAFVGKAGYRDPACDLVDAPSAAGRDQRESSCALAFGTSTGALGYRKFPNPRFDRERWRQLNGSLASWRGYNRRLSEDPASSDHGVRRLSDGSIEPPYLIGTSCGSCHIAFDPLNPPDDPAHPKWENIVGAIGNQYLRISEALASGMPVASLEFQMFAHARPGTSDTSAIPNDMVNNPGTINAIINFRQRPTFDNELVDKWRRTDACPAGDDGAACWCEPGRGNKCWRRSAQRERVHHILKGGEDSIGFHEAIQRVYFNIGSCAEQCWVNHLTDLRQLDPKARNFAQTPFDIAQCRRDCPNFRAIEDRLGDIGNFLLSRRTRPTDLAEARQNRLRESDPGARYAQADLIAELERHFGDGAVTRGRELFAGNCARCHSSIPESAGGPFEHRDFRALDADTGLRQDWLGNDAATPATEVGSNRCRALHSNHMQGHVWEQFGSDTLRTRAADPGIAEPGDGGRGSYRNISLLSLWAHAPFLHNNALGPEICGHPAQDENFFYRNPYVDRESGQPLADAPACWAYDPSVDGRFKLYVASMQALLNPDARIPKVTRFDVDVPLTAGLRVIEDGQEKQLAGLTVVVPRGSTAGGLGSFRYKDFLVDLVALRLHPQTLTDKYTRALGDEEGAATFADLKQVADELLTAPEQLVPTMRRHPQLLQLYSSCTASIENEGHRFGEDLSETDKQALIAFLATL